MMHNGNDACKSVCVLNIRSLDILSSCNLYYFLFWFDGIFIRGGHAVYDALYKLIINEFQFDMRRTQWSGFDKQVLSVHLTKRVSAATVIIFLAVPAAKSTSEGLVTEAKEIIAHAE